MYNKVEICRELAEILLELGDYGRELNVSYDDKLQVWRVRYDRGGRPAMIFMEEEDVDRCLSGKGCLSRGFHARQPRERPAAFR